MCNASAVTTILLLGRDSSRTGRAAISPVFAGSWCCAATIPPRVTAASRCGAAMSRVFAPRKVLPSTATTMRPFHRVASRASSHAPTIADSSSASRAWRIRRIVDSDGTRRPGRSSPDVARRSRPTSAAHSAIATRLLAPAHTAAVAMARTPARSWRRPRRPRGSAMVANTPSSDWPQTGMVRDDEHTRGAS